VSNSSEVSIFQSRSGDSSVVRRVSLMVCALDFGSRSLVRALAGVFALCS